MKIRKDGKVILTQADTQVGNFVFTKGEKYITVRDINSTIVLRISAVTALYVLLSEAIESKNEDFLANYGAMVYYVNGVVPDVEFWGELSRSAKSCIERHPELYGQNEETDDEADAAIIRNEKEMHEALLN